MLGKIRYKGQGFSLLEMIVVIAILGISLSMLYKAAGSATRSIKISEQYSYAVVLAQSLLAEYSTVPAGGVSIEGSSDEYRWVVSSTPVIDEGGVGQVEQSIILYHIAADIHWQSGRSSRVYTLSSVVPVRADIEMFE